MKKIFVFMAYCLLFIKIRPAFNENHPQQTNNRLIALINRLSNELQEINPDIQDLLQNTENFSETLQEGNLHLSPSSCNTIVLHLDNMQQEPNIGPYIERITILKNSLEESISRDDNAPQQNFNENENHIFEH